MGLAENRDVVGVILRLRSTLSDAPRWDRPDVAAEFLCDIFGGTSAALNLMDYGLGRFQTVVNVGRLTAIERSRPNGEFYDFADFPFTSHQLFKGGAYRAHLGDDLCPPEYRDLLRAQGRGACLGAPISQTRRPVGEFWIARETGEPFSESDADLAVACGATLARFVGPAEMMSAAS